MKPESFMPHSLSRRARLTAITLLGCLLGTGCATTQSDPVPSLELDVSSGHARFVGPIDWDSVHHFQALVKGNKVRVLEVDSRGGNTEAAIALGYWIHQQNLTLEVSRLCLGSCANYWFTAARKKLIQPGAIVAWQGNLHSQLLKNEQPELFAQKKTTATADELRLLRQQVSLELLFFKQIGVDERVCWIGKLPPYNANGYFVLPPEDLRRFAIREVRTEIDYSARSVERWQNQFPVQKVVLPFGGAL
jgi:hypothetical protein